MDNEHLQPRRELNVFDAVCIIVGIIIGAGIFKTTPFIASMSNNWMWLIGGWCLGGFIAICGALCYAELATAYPRQGGDYVYLKEGFGLPFATMFAWVLFWIIRPAATGPMALLFGDYMHSVYPLAEKIQISTTLYATLAVVAITGINIAGLQAGKWTQNILSTIKVLALLAIVGIAFLGPQEAIPFETTARLEDPFGAFLVALVLIMFTYGGWSDLSFISSEIKNPNQNILRSLMIGVGAVIGIYLLINFAFLQVLGHDGLANSSIPASMIVEKQAGANMAKVVSLLISLSALGAIHGMIFTGSRVAYAVGKHTQGFHWLNSWNTKMNVPVRAVLAQSFPILMLVGCFGMMKADGGSGPVDGFTMLALFSSPFFLTFSLSVAVVFFVLRERDKETARPYRTPGYPIVPGIFLVAMAFMLYRSITYFVGEVQSKDLLSSSYFVAVLGYTAVMIICGLIIALQRERSPMSDDEVPSE